MKYLEDTSHPRHAATAAALKTFVKSLTGRWKGNPDQELKDRLHWTLFFRQNYREIVAMGKQ